MPFFCVYTKFEKEPLRKLFNVSSATANRILARFVNDGKLIKIRQGKTLAYAKI